MVMPSGPARTLMPAVGNQQRGHPRFVHPDADAIAGDSRLGDLEERASDAILVADTDLAIGQTFDGEVFSKLSKGEVCAAKFFLPISIRFHLVNEYRAVLTAVARQVPLRVTVDVQPPNHALALDRFLPNSRADSLSAPRDLTGQTHIHRVKPSSHLQNRFAC